jgi:hypothetical protein
MVTAFRAVQGAEAWAADGGWVTEGTTVLLPAASSTARRWPCRPSAGRPTGLRRCGSPAWPGRRPAGRRRPAALVAGHLAGPALLGAAGTDTALTGMLAGWDRVLSPAVLNLTPSSSATCHRLGARVAGDVAAGEQTAAGLILVRAVPARRCWEGCAASG